jgi:hypothetical protein
LKARLRKDISEQAAMFTEKQKLGKINKSVENFTFPKRIVNIEVIKADKMEIPDTVAPFFYYQFYKAEEVFSNNFKGR